MSCKEASSAIIAQLSNFNRAQILSIQIVGSPDFMEGII